MQAIGAEPKYHRKDVEVISEHTGKTEDNRKTIQLTDVFVVREEIVVVGQNKHAKEWKVTNDKQRRREFRHPPFAEHALE